MAGAQLIGPMPELTLDSGCTVTFEAIDPLTGANVTGVTITKATLYGVNLAPDFDTPVKPEDLPTPLWVPIPNEVAG